MGKDELIDEALGLRPKKDRGKERALDRVLSSMADAAWERHQNGKERALDEALEQAFAPQQGNGNVRKNEETHLGLQRYYEEVENERSFIKTLADKMVGNGQLEEAAEYLFHEYNQTKNKMEVRAYAAELAGDIYTKLKMVEDARLSYDEAVAMLDFITKNMEESKNFTSEMEHNILLMQLLGMKCSDVIYDALKGSTKENENLKSDIDVLTKKNEEMRAIIDAHDNKPLIDLNVLEEKEKSLKARIEKERQQYLSENEALRKQNAAIVKSLEDIGDLPSQKQALSQENKDLRGLISSLERKISEQEEELSPKQSLIQELQLERYRYSSENKKLKAQNKKLSSVLRKKEEEAKMRAKPTRKIIKFKDVGSITLNERLAEKESQIRSYTESEFRVSYRREDYQNVLFDRSIQLNDKEGLKTRIGSLETFKSMKSALQKAGREPSVIAEDKPNTYTYRMKEYYQILAQPHERREGEAKKGKSDQDMFIEDLALILSGEYTEEGRKYSNWAGEGGRISKIMERYSAVSGIRFNRDEKDRLRDIFGILSDNRYIKNKLSKNHRKYDPRFESEYKAMMEKLRPLTAGY